MGSVAGGGECHLWSRQTTLQCLLNIFSFTSPGKWVGTPVSSSPRWVDIGGVEGPWFQLLDVCFFLSLWTMKRESENVSVHVAALYILWFGFTGGFLDLVNNQGKFLDTILVAVSQLFFFSFIDTILLYSLSCSQLLENFLYSSPLLSCLDRLEDTVESECDPPITIQWSIGCFKKS